MDASSIVDPFHRRLYLELVDDIDGKMVALAQGSAGTYEDYRGQSSYIQALNDVLEKCRKIERELYGTRSGGEGQPG